MGRSGEERHLWKKEGGEFNITQASFGQINIWFNTAGGGTMSPSSQMFLKTQLSGRKNIHKKKKKSLSNIFSYPCIASQVLFSFLIGPKKVWSVFYQVNNVWHDIVLYIHIFISFFFSWIRSDKQQTKRTVSAKGNKICQNQNGRTRNTRQEP